MPASANLPRFIVTIDGTKMTDDFMRDVEEIVVDTSLHVPDMVAIRLQDDDLEWMDSTTFDLGKAIKITAQSATSTGGETGDLVEAEITGLEPQFDAEGTHTLIVRAYDKSHRLHLGHHTRTFTKQTDSDVVKKLAQEAGMQSDVDATTIRYDYLIQNNQSNMEYLVERARHIGYRVFTSAGKLYFKKPDYVLSMNVTLTLGESLRSFRPRMSTAHQVNKARVISWDTKAKKEIVQEQPQPAFTQQGGMKKTGGATADSAFGQKPPFTISDQPLNTVDEAKALATGLAVELGQDFMEAEGICYGNPKVVAGAKITIEGVGTRFSGPYVVTSATHIYNKDGYETHFTVSGNQPNSFNQLLGRGNGGRRGSGRIDGVVVGVVTNLKDPDDLGRVKVKYPWLAGETASEAVESWWARMAAPMAGQDTKGFMFLPEVNDEVLVAFEHGDMTRPYIVGTLWNGKDKPPKSISAIEKAGKINQRVIRTRVGHMITLDDSDDKPSIEILDKTGKNRIHIDSKTNKLTVEMQGDMEFTAGGNITMTARGKITLDATGDITENTKGRFVVDTKTSATVTAVSEIKLDSKGLGTVQANGLLAVKSNSTLDLQGAALAQLKGALVKIN